MEQLTALTVQIELSDVVQVSIKLLLKDYFKTRSNKHIIPTR